MLLPFSRRAVRVWTLRAERIFAGRSESAAPDAPLNNVVREWLDRSRPGLRLRFPAALEARFEADTGALRCRMMMVFGIVGSVLRTCLYPAICDTMPDVSDMARHYYLQFAMPLCFLTSVSMRFNPRPFLREGLTLLANAACTCTIMYLYAHSRTNHESIIVAAVTVQMVYSAIGIQLRFPFAVCAVMLLGVTYGLALETRLGLGGLERRDLMLLTIATAAYLLLANWRMEREGRRTYLMMLRESLQKQDLSVRNLELDALARRDPLTGIANRRAYDAWLVTCWEQAAARQERLSLVVLDVDRFKAFNDFYGHAAGDQCLQKIAMCLREQLRGANDLLARIGGEEFAVLLPGMEQDVCADVAERMREAVQRLELPHPGLGPNGLVSISAGVASQVVQPGLASGSLFEAADKALYEAKLSGRNRVCVATILHPSSAKQPAAG